MTTTPKLRTAIACDCLPLADLARLWAQATIALAARGPEALRAAAATLNAEPFGAPALEDCADAIFQFETEDADTTEKDRAA